MTTSRTGLGSAWLCGALICAGVLAHGALSTAQPVPSSSAAPAEFNADFETSAGEFSVHVVRAWAPIGVDRLYTLLGQGFYDGTRVFRVVPGFGVQFGISGDPEVSRRWQTAKLGVDRVRRSNRSMFVALAMGVGPDTRTTQLFISLDDNRKLDAHGLAPLGWVTRGQDVVRRFYAGYYGDGPVEGGPEQWRIHAEGNAYLEREFPRLDYVIRAAVRSR